MITDIESATPALCRLQLGSELRQLRQAAGLNGRQVVRKLLWSSSKLTRLETGDNAAVEPSDVIALCQIYGATSEKRAMLEGYAAVTKTRGLVAVGGVSAGDPAGVQGVPGIGGHRQRLPELRV